MSYKKKKDGKVTKMVDDDGEVIYDVERTVNRSKVSQESINNLIDAIDAEDGDKFRRHVFEILTGQTVREAR